MWRPPYQSKKSLRFHLCPLLLACCLHYFVENLHKWGLAWSLLSVKVEEKLGHLVFPSTFFPFLLFYMGLEKYATFSFLFYLFLYLFSTFFEFKDGGLRLWKNWATYFFSFHFSFLHSILTSLSLSFSTLLKLQENRGHFLFPVFLLHCITASLSISFSTFFGVKENWGHFPFPIFLLHCYTYLEICMTVINV